MKQIPEAMVYSDVLTVSHQLPFSETRVSIIRTVSSWDRVRQINFALEKNQPLIIPRKYIILLFSLHEQHQAYRSPSKIKKATPGYISIKPTLEGHLYKNVSHWMWQQVHVSLNCPVLTTVLCLSSADIWSSHQQRVGSLQ